MSAYTALCPTALQAFLADHAVGALLDSRPIHDASKTAITACARNGANTSSPCSNP
ncbi:hypothetical protein [Methylogaea oryzae]|uniref:hypothetical protein n=1 Tax=Methylogaea oryzae TaxID=1295382 RepID=UPI0012E27451|nr:hypothetical protein [Methylogaea oryzae]